MRAFLEDLGYDPGQVADDVIRQTDSFLGKYYAALHNEHQYIRDWAVQQNPISGEVGYVSPSLSVTQGSYLQSSGITLFSKIGYSLKYYPERSKSIGLIRSGGHFAEWSLEMLDGHVFRRITGRDNMIYNMHYDNSYNYLKYR